MDWLSDVEAVAMDMNASYNALISERMPRTRIVYDRYHMQAQFGRNVLGAVRLEGFNNRTKVAKRIAYGYRNEDYFFSLIRYISIPSNRSQSPMKT